MNNVVTEAEYNELKARVEKYNAWVDTQRTKKKCRGCKGTGKGWSTSKRLFGRLSETCRKCDGKGFVLGWASYKLEDVPEHIQALNVTNHERSLIEVYEFVRDKPNKYFAYVDVDKMVIANFPGVVLGKITWKGPEYRLRAGFGGIDSVRQNLRIAGINNVVYSAVYYKSSGDYCRMKAFKNGGVK